MITPETIKQWEKEFREKIKPLPSNKNTLYSWIACNFNAYTKHTK